jgi:hypothetical protein
MKDSYQKAAEYHQAAIQAHRAAATHHEKGDHQRGREYSREALELSQAAYEYSLELAENGQTRKAKTLRRGISLDCSQTPGRMKILPYGPNATPEDANQTK